MEIDDDEETFNRKSRELERVENLRREFENHHGHIISPESPHRTPEPPHRTPESPPEIHPLRRRRRDIQTP